MNPGTAEKIMSDLCSDGEEWKCILIAKIAEPEIKEGIILASYHNG